jgi:hypothetical protein
MQAAIAYGTTMTTVGLVLSLQYIGTGRRLGTASAAALGVVVLLTTRVVSPADLASGFEVLWRPVLAITAIMLSTNVAQRLGILDYAARLIEPRPGQPVIRVSYRRTLVRLSRAQSARRAGAECSHRLRGNPQIAKRPC